MSVDVVFLEWEYWKRWKDLLCGVTTTTNIETVPNDNQPASADFGPIQPARNMECSKTASASPPWWMTLITAKWSRDCEYNMDFSTNMEELTVHMACNWYLLFSLFKQLLHYQVKCKLLMALMYETMMMITTLWLDREMISLPVSDHNIGWTGKWLPVSDHSCLAIVLLH